MGEGGGGRVVDRFSAVGPSNFGFWQVFLKGWVGFEGFVDRFGLVFGGFWLIFGDGFGGLK